MDLSINRPITSEAIYNAVQLVSQHPVYKLEGFGNNNAIDEIVIKFESKGNEEVGRANSIMRYVDPHARQENLTPAEIQALRAWTEPGGWGYVKDVDVTTLESLKYFLAQVGGTWFKMEVKSLTSIGSVVAKRFKGRGSKTDVRIVANALRQVGGLEALGQIIAADFFNGNSDRFVRKNKMKKNKHLPAKYKTITNEGNVLITCDGNGSGRPIGLDSFDPHAGMRPEDEVNIATWEGMLLHHNQANERRTFARHVIEDLEMALGPRNRKHIFKSRTRLGRKRKQRLLDGMEQGANIIRANLRHDVLSESVRSRMQALGWEIG